MALDELLATVRSDSRTLALDSLYAFCLYGDTTMEWPCEHSREPSTERSSELAGIGPESRGWGTMAHDDKLDDQAFGELVLEVVPALGLDPRDIQLQLDAWLEASPHSQEQADARDLLAISLGLHQPGASDRAFGASRPQPGGAAHDDSKPLSEETAAKLRALARPGDPPAGPQTDEDPP
jgi:hypothetical protein